MKSAESSKDVKFWNLAHTESELQFEWINQFENSLMNLITQVSSQCHDHFNITQPKK